MDGYYILTGIGFVFILGCLSIILDMTYDKDNYIQPKKQKAKIIPPAPIEEDYDVIINEDDSLS